LQSKQCSPCRHRAHCRRWNTTGVGQGERLGMELRLPLTDSWRWLGQWSLRRRRGGWRSASAPTAGGLRPCGQDRRWHRRRGSLGGGEEGWPALDGAGGGIRRRAAPRWRRRPRGRARRQRRVRLLGLHTWACKRGLGKLPGVKSTACQRGSVHAPECITAAACAGA
jgi:hypothetical protein